MHADAVVVGGGIVGCAIARALAMDGRRTVLVERGPVGREASWAGAGLLTPIHLAEYPTPLARLCEASAALWSSFAKAIRDEAGMDVEYRTNGLIMLARTREDATAIQALSAWKREHGGPAEVVDAPRDLEPILSPELRGGLLLPDIAQVRNNRVAPALALAAAAAGADVRPDCAVTGFLRVPGRVTGVKTSRGDVLARDTIVAAGAWSAELLATVGVTIGVRPVRGQIVLLEASSEVLRRTVLWGDRYVVPRADGRLILGSTLEDVGFDARVTAAGVSDILGDALRVAPGLSALPVARTWAGLRPATPDRMPYIGRPEDVNGLILATGHYRNGIVLAPITAALIADLVAGRAPSVDLTPFRAGR
jgi:glycine oxidase